MHTFIHPGVSNKNNLSVDDLKKAADKCADSIAKAVIAYESKAGIIIESITMEPFGDSLGREITVNLIGGNVFKIDI